jgi:hypothetical protein
MLKHLSISTNIKKPVLKVFKYKLKYLTPCLIATTTEVNWSLLTIDSLKLFENIVELRLTTCTTPEYSGAFDMTTNVLIDNITLKY